MRGSSRWCVAGAVVVLALSACGDDRPGPVLPPVPSSGSASASPTPSPSPSVRPTGTAEEQILGQYRRFWTETYPTVFSAPADERRALLSPVVGEPLLSELLRIASERDRAGKSTRGTPVLTEPVVSREGGLAVVSDCVDLTDVVLVDRSTGAVTEDGPDRKPTDTYLRRGSDAVWRVYSLNEPRGYRC